MKDSSDSLAIKAGLRRTWDPFFSRFGRLLPIQSMVQRGFFTWSFDKLAAILK